MRVVGPEIYPPSLEPVILKPFVLYNKFFGFAAALFHIPAAIINTFAATVKFKPDLIICVGGVFYNGFAAVISAKLCKCQCLIRTAEDHYKTARLQPTFARALYHKFVVLPLSRLTLSSANWVMTVGEMSKRYFISKGVSKNKIFQAPNPIQLNMFSNFKGVPKSKLREELGIKFRNKVALFIGGGEPTKGADLLPEIILKVISKSDDWSFVVVGATDTASNALKKELEEIVKGGRLQTMSALPYTRLSTLYNSVDVIVFLAKIGVGYGLVTIEAALCGCPTLCLDPKLDVEELHGTSPRNVDEFVHSLITERYKVPDVSRFTDLELNYQKHTDIVMRCLKN